MSEVLDALCALAKLTPNQREAFVNREILGWSDGRTAAAMGLSASRVSNLVLAARKNLGLGSAPKVVGECVGCGGSTDKSTVGCKRCSQRRYDRRRAEAKKAA